MAAAPPAPGQVASAALDGHSSNVTRAKKNPATTPVNAAGSQGQSARKRRGFSASFNGFPSNRKPQGRQACLKEKTGRPLRLGG
jgi:hypothetical protein